MNACWSCVRNGSRDIVTRAGLSPPRAKRTVRSFMPRKPATQDSGSFDFAFHAGCLLESEGRYGEAAEYFGRAAALETGGGLSAAPVVGRQVRPAGLR